VAVGCYWVATITTPCSSAMSCFSFSRTHSLSHTHTHTHTITHPHTHIPTGIHRHKVTVMIVTISCDGILSSPCHTHSLSLSRTHTSTHPHTHTRTGIHRHKETEEIATISRDGMMLTWTKHLQFVRAFRCNEPKANTPRGILGHVMATCDTPCSNLIGV